MTKDEIREVATVVVVEPLLRLLEADPHQFSTRPCQTCTAVSAIAGQDFGCVKKRKGQVKL